MIADYVVLAQHQIAAGAGKRPSPDAFGVANGSSGSRPPRRGGLTNGRNRRIAPIALRPAGGLLADCITGTRGRRQELVFVPLSGH
jgi:hypothetical protein